MKAGTYLELTSRALVDVVSDADQWGCVKLADGSIAWTAQLTRPDWLIEAEQEAADVADLQSTRQDVIYG